VASSSKLFGCRKPSINKSIQKLIAGIMLKDERKIWPEFNKFILISGFVMAQDMDDFDISY
jgi:hypothetical protein